MCNAALKPKQYKQNTYTHNSREKNLLLSLEVQALNCWNKFYRFSDGELAGQWASMFKVGKHLYTEAYNTTCQVLTLACVIQVSKLCRTGGRNLKDSARRMLDR